ncbi:energy transducer TonB [Anaeromyxobacter oryzisoli]|uniref:energy transducer TonB n=1 Tax=Anaeromyxobacter oryzisoli TaxID=2925408 RepID=UPI001F592ACA|nr:TonB family protein [Anaeromyxobacter sp. SG63]
MFEEVTKREDGKRAANKARYVLGAAVVQIVLGVALVLATRTEEKLDGPTVPVIIVRPSRPLAPAPPPPAPPAAPERPAQGPRVAPSRPSRPQPLIQPKELPAPVKPREPEPPEPGPAPEGTSAGTSAAAGAGVGEGVAGGAAGGVVGGVVGATAEPAQQPQRDDAPAFATAGYRKPRTAQPGCLGSSLRVPRALAAFVSGPVVVKFAVNRDGTPSRFEVVTSVPDRRIADAIWSAVQACRWIPGADAQGRPTAVWVIQPIRFAGG